MQQLTVIALGGSLVVPHLSDDGGVNISFLSDFRRFLLKELKNGKRFVVVVGGGKTCRMYNASAEKVVRVADEDLDWLGIHATRLNAHLLRTIFAEEAYPVVIDHDPSPEEVKSLQRKKESLYIASGWRPGWSTDYVGVQLARKFSGKELIIAGDTPYVYDKDPKKYSDAKELSELTWKEYQKLIPKKWSPALSSPVDPPASRLAKKEGILVKIVQGSDFENFKNAVEGKEFKGTVIS